MSSESTTRWETAPAQQPTQFPYGWLEGFLVCLLGTLAGATGGLTLWIILVALPLKLQNETQRQAFLYLLVLGVIVGLGWTLKLVLKRVPSSRRA